MQTKNDKDGLNNYERLNLLNAIHGAGVPEKFTYLDSKYSKFIVNVSNSFGREYKFSGKELAKLSYNELEDFYILVRGYQIEKLGLRWV